MIQLAPNKRELPRDTKQFTKGTICQVPAKRKTFHKKEINGNIDQKLNKGVFVGKDIKKRSHQMYYFY